MLGTGFPENLIRPLAHDVPNITIPPTRPNATEKSERFIRYTRLIP
jgi:hypothetical protein